MSAVKKTMNYLDNMSEGQSLLWGVVPNAISSITGGLFNWLESRAARKEAREMAEKEFAWTQERDRFAMEATNRQLAESRRMNDYQMVADRVQQMNEALRTNVGLRDRMISLWGGGK
jgi:hypothetical protein